MGRVGRPIRVLHVDDEPAFAELVAAFLQEAEPRLSVETVHDAEAALERLDEGAFDCVVSDFEMPGRDGIELLEAVREDHPSLPFVLFTGRGSEEVASEAISAGVTDYLQKQPGDEPYALLANRLVNLVAGERSREALAERRRTLETLIDNLPGLVYRCRNEPGWPIEHVVGECEPLTGYPAAALESGAVSYGNDLIHPDDREAVWETVQAALEVDEAFELTYRLVTADGTERWVWERGRALRDDDGDVEALEGFVTDVTDRRARERAIEELQSTTSAFVTADSAEAVADIVVEAVSDVLDRPANSVHLFDDARGCLAPVAWTDACEALVGDLPDIGPGEGLAWEVFASGEDQVHGDVSTVDGRLNPETSVRSEIILPLGDHGVVLICSGAVDAFDATDVSLGRTLATHAVAALDRLEREGEIARQRTMLEAQQEAVLDGVLVVDDEGDFVSYNDQFVELWGLPEAVVEEGDEAALEWVTDQLADPEGFLEQVEYLYAHPEETSRDEIELADGRVFDRYTTPLTGEGTSFGRLWTFRDVTERRRHERHLERLQARTQELMHTATVEETAEVAIESASEDLGAELSGVYRLSDDGERLEPVAVLERFREAKGHVPPYRRDSDVPTDRVVWEAFASGEPVVIDDTREHGDLAANSPSRSAIVHPLGDAGVFIASSTEPRAFDELDRHRIDILATALTAALDRVERESDLQHERDRLSALFEMVPDPITRVRFDGDQPVVVDVNSAFERTFGIDRETVVGGSVNDFIVPEDRPADGERVDEAVREEGIVVREVRRRTADGVADFLFRSVPIGDETETDEYYGVYVDVSEQKATERALERQNERLEQFASVASHDLRNPLTVAMGHLELFREEGEEEDLDAVARALERMQSLIDDLLVLARGERSLEPEPVDLDDVVAGCWRNVSTADATLACETGLTIDADRNRLAQLLENLFRNAVDHGGETVAVTVTALDDGFAVEDDGPGIPADLRDRVFELGFSTSDGGTGFGLGIGREVTEAHGWSIEAVEGSAGGARIEVTGVDVR